MSEYDDQLLKLKLISSARQILNDEYEHRHRDEYSAWSTRHQEAWKGPHTPLPYPPYISSPSFAPFRCSMSFPSEADVVAKALELYNQTVSPSTVPAPPVPPPPVAQPVAQPVSWPVPVPRNAPEEILVGQSVGPALFVEEQPVIEEPVIEEPVIEESVIEESVIEESVIEPEILETVESVLVEEAPTVDSYTAQIHKIYSTPTEESTITLPPPFIIDLPPMPMPAEELAKASEETGKLLPTILKKIEDLKMTWSKKSPTDNGAV